jgi:adenine-specific DNA-methyltransferase
MGFFADPPVVRTAIRYIGSKARVVDDLIEIIGPPAGDVGVFVDAFCGTGVVGARAADLGWSVRVNDNLLSAVVVSTANLLSAEQVPFDRLGGYEAVVEKLNAAAPRRGFVWREYSPAGPAGRRYFSAENAARIDAVRDRISDWELSDKLSSNESSLLRADLIAAAGRVANIAGTYGCYLADWTATARRSFTLLARRLRETSALDSAYCGDVVYTPMAENDTAYFDPPYTKRQYAAYYHLNETLACGDEPKLEGKTGLRPWRDKASDYCYKTRALEALGTLIRNASAQRVFLSYSSQGHVGLDELCRTLRPLGNLDLHELGAIGRYRPNQAASSAGAEVIEFLVEIDRAPVISNAVL